MLSRFNVLSMARALYTKGVALVKKFFIYYFDDLIHLPERSSLSPNGTAIAKVGPEWLLPKLTLIRPRSADNAAETLKLIMDAPDFDSRKYYSYFGFFIGADFFLSMNDEKGMALRKKIIPYLHPKNIEIDYYEEIHQLFSDLINPLKQDNYHTILNHFLDLFCRAVAGISLTTQMRKTLLEIDAISESRIPLYFGLLPISLLKFAPSIRKLRSETETNIKSFLYEQITLLKEQELQGTLKSNWLVEIIKEKYQKTPNQLSSKEIEELLTNSDARICLGVILGVSNLAKAITTMLCHLFANASDSIKQLKRLNEEVNKFQLESPYLHAVYLETLRHFMSDFFIARYSAKGIKSINIPAKTIVTFQFSSAKSYHAINTYSADSFAPERFLDEKGQLNQHATLGKGFFTPFGVGKRPCPGSHLAEKIFKNYLCFFARHIKYFDASLITFHSTLTEFREKELLTHSLRYHFFCPKNQNQIETEKVIHLIQEYVYS